MQSCTSMFSWLTPSEAFSIGHKTCGSFYFFSHDYLFSLVLPPHVQFKLMPLMYMIASCARASSVVIVSKVPVPECNAKSWEDYHAPTGYLGLVVGRVKLSNACVRNGVCVFKCSQGQLRGHRVQLKLDGILSTRQGIEHWDRLVCFDLCKEEAGLTSGIVALRISAAASSMSPVQDGIPKAGVFW